jgi:DNA topoisomerase-1
MPAADAPEAAAAAAGLHYVSADEPGITRLRWGRGFTYRTHAGETVPKGPDRERIDSLAVPPAWTEVWICARPDGHVQATGRDARGRKQYRYHDDWGAARAEDKFEQLAAFGDRLGSIRRRVADDLDCRGLPKERVVALVVRLLDETLVRVGNPEYARDESFGLTTLESRHVNIDGRDLVFEFEGKSGVEQEVPVDDPELVRMVRACDDLGDAQLFAYRDGDDIIGICSDDVNEYLRRIAGPATSARDFRTWGGTVAVVEDLGPLDTHDEPDIGVERRFLEAVDRAAERLGNTRAVCRESYVHPVVEQAFQSGDLHQAWKRSRRSRRLTRAERTTLRLLSRPVGAHT